MKNLPKVTIYTDGACLGNPGAGGYCAILVHEKGEKVVSGGEPDTTNNRMELMAAIAGLKALNRPCKVTLVSDSRYVVDGINEWLENWIAKGIHSRKNADLWKETHRLLKKHKVTGVWVKGHSGHEMNERCDKIANSEAKRMVKTHGTVERNAEGR